MTIDLQVQKIVVHKFLPIPQKTFSTQPSTVEMESSHSLLKEWRRLFQNSLKLSFKYHL